MNNSDSYLETSLIAAAIILACDVVLGQSALALAAESFAVAALLALAAARLAMGQREAAARGGGKALVFAAAFLLSLGFDLGNKALARNRAEQVIAACKSFKEKTGAYPATLQALVPEYLGSVPRARYTILWGKFHYADNRLAWVIAPMTVMPSYDLSTEKWSFSPAEALPAILRK